MPSPGGQPGRCLQMVIMGLVSPSSSKVLFGRPMPVLQAMKYLSLGPRPWPVSLVYRQSSVLTLHDYNACQGISVLTDSKSSIQRVAQQTDTTCSSIWMVLATIGSSTLVNGQWIAGHVGLDGNTKADLEAKRGTTLPQYHLWISIQLVQLSNSINRASLTTDI